MPIRFRLGALALLAFTCPGLAPAQAADLQLEKFVVLMRHGIRPPTNTKEIAPLAAKAWPEWGVPDGMLTPHGRDVATKLGAWEGKMLADRGLLRSPECPAPGEVFAWASGALQRTVDTGNAFLDGMFPGCGIATRHHEVKGSDPLFTAAETDVGRLDLDKGRAAILAAMGGSLDKGRERLAPLMAELQTILDCCQPEPCEKAGKPEGCTFEERPWAIKEKNDGRNLSLEGPIGQAPTVSQVFLLEYANGLAADQVAWGRASTADDVRRLSELRKVKYEYFERIPYIARRGASNIFNQLLLAIDAPAQGAAAAAEGGPPPAKLVLFVGSDTQIAEIGGMLNAHWKLASYLDDETPPTGGLAFEVLRDAGSRQRFVRMSFLTPGLDQLRAAAAFDASNPPEMVPVAVPGCDGAGPDHACPLDRFVDIGRKTIDPTAVAAQSYD